MAGSIKVDIVSNKFRVYSNSAKKAYTKALGDCIDDLVRTSSQSAPHDEGVLEKSWSKEIAFNGNQPYGEVSYSVKGKSGYNYALKMHEGGYQLGEGSLAKRGGTGMSGKSYPVGPKYLTGVLNGEKDAYRKHIEQALAGVTNGL